MTEKRCLAVVNFTIMAFGYKYIVFRKKYIEITIFSCYNTNKLQIGILRIIVKYPQ